MARSELEVLVDDLFRLGDYNKWEKPKQPDNISWFHENRKPFSLSDSQIYQNEELIVKRLENLVETGADITKKAYLIGNINNPVILQAALKLGANPNTLGKTGLLPIERAFSKGRSSVVEVLISDPNFDFQQRDRTGLNVLFMAIGTGKYKIASNVLAIKPELSLERDFDNSTIMLCLANYLSSKQKMNSKVITFLNSCMNYASKQNVYFSVTETNNKNQSISSLYPALGEFISEKQALDLLQKLGKKENETKKINFKI